MHNYLLASTSTTLLLEPSHIILGLLLILSSIGVIVAKKPVYSSLSFLLSLLVLASLYLELSAQFIGVMQVLVYAGAILVIFMFVIVLFQDAHYEISLFKAQSSSLWIGIAALAFFSALAYFGYRLLTLQPEKNSLPNEYGTVESLGQVLYLDFFFPFEAVILIFLIAVAGSLYIGRKEG